MIDDDGMRGKQRLRAKAQNRGHQNDEASGAEYGGYRKRKETAQGLKPTEHRDEAKKAKRND